MSNFMQNLAETHDNQYNVSVTENGALGYKTTKSALLDLNFQIASLRRASDKEIADKFMAAFLEDRVLAMRFLFWVRDIRGGLGERRFFRVVLVWLAQEYPEVVKAVLPLIADFGRWDDVWVLLDTPLRKDVIKLTKEQLLNDCKTAGVSVSW